MKKLLLFFTFSTLYLFIVAQDRVQVQSDSLKITIEKEGALFSDNFGDINPGLTTISDESLLFASNLWFAGYDADGNLRGAFETFSGSERMHLAGTINSGQLASVSNPLTQVSAVEIENHRTSFGEQGYEMPAGIAKWPANGDTTIGEMWQMAPFIDLNDNGIYEPEQGEYPDIFGDVCVYLIKNDGGSTLTQPLGVEEHYMIGVFNSGHQGSTHLSQTVVMNTTLYHRGTVPIDTLHVGLWHDGDLGDPRDDFMDTNVPTNSVVFYNGDNFDDTQFRENPPALAIGSMFCDLWGSMWGSIFNGGGTIDVEENLQAKWSDGTCQIQAGSGHISGVAGTDYPLTRYAFDGDLDLDTGWTELNSFNNAGDRRALTILQPKVFHPGDQISYTLAFHLAQGEGLDYVGNAVLASERIALVEDELLTLYGDHPRLVLSQNCESLEIVRDCDRAVGISENLVLDAFKVFPNPSEGIIHFEYPEAATEVTVTNILGQEIRRFQADQKPESLVLTPGSYLVRVALGNMGVISKRVVIQ